MWEQLETGEGQEAPPASWRRRQVLGVWFMVSLVLTGLPRVVAHVIDSETPFVWSEVLGDLFGWLLWILFFPVILSVIRRFPFRWHRWPSWLVVNLALGTLITLLYASLAHWAKQLVKAGGLLLQGSSAGSAFSFDVEHQLTFALYGMHFSLLAYMAIFAVLHAADYFRKYRERELKTSRLETQLVQSQLKALRTQLRPHFLFNTLNAISALMHRDVEAADRMIALLSDLLRLSLEKDERHQVTLRSELDFLRRYLAIEEIRFGDRLDVRLDIAEDCLSAQVPKLILQPLVENSIRHGIAMRSAAGVVAILARRTGDRLEIQISDDGPGLPAEGESLREGVGLANTRARLEQLYGEEHDLELRSGRFGGFEVALSLPFEEEARFPMQGAA